VLNLSSLLPSAWRSHSHIGDEAALQGMG